MMTQRQIDHLKANQALFDEAYALPGETRDIDEYINEYDDDEHPDLYIGLCSDMGLEPLPPEEYTFTLVVSAEEYSRLLEELDRPARELPKLAALLRAQSPWEPR
jgi:hypothetical protein